MFLWLILTGLICFLLGIALTLAVGQQKILFWIMPLMDSDDKLLPQLNPESTTPLIQSEKPISVGLPEVIIFTSRWLKLLIELNTIAFSSSIFLLYITQKVIKYR